MITFLSIAQADIIAPETMQLQQQLAVAGLEFEGLVVEGPEAYSATKILSEREALQSLYREELGLGDLVAETESLKVSYALGRLSDPFLAQVQENGMVVDPTFLTPRLVWIITLRGISIPASNTPNTPCRQANWINFVLDAVTGSSLMGFI